MDERAEAVEYVKWKITQLRNELAFLASDPRPLEIIEPKKAEIRRQIAALQSK